MDVAFRDAVERDGFALAAASVASEDIDLVAAAVAEAPGHGRAGRRNVLAIPAVGRLATRGPMRDAATAILGSDCGAVRAILFDKNHGANWHVIWHQDVTIAIESAVAAPAYGPWSMKDGVPHARPPVGVLEGMIAVRLHIDPCTETDGPLRVVPGSHRSGILDADAIEAWRARLPPSLCVADRGGIVVMRPLLLHASSAASSGRRRRVLHVEYGPRVLPDGVRWHTWVGPSAQERLSGNLR